MLEIASKLGAAGLLGVILWNVLFKVGTGIADGIRVLAGEVKSQTVAISSNTAALSRIEGKLDHQMTIDREQIRLERSRSERDSERFGRITPIPSSGGG